ncbi:PDZ domain-containing protein [Natranaerobius thermophilus]|uniref:PDZ/DHR/GLGF domain protein n=1 Tax=Natranaerobius thermophilus (strain ATCC BAA-1301 / DSM 18059 / JW/NM-WN-LF) TaxID=457570 RepID=B2A7Y6_NATTJ|nr:PDZ domain-containing protein [Natranaerobius thermophilus]ACB85758.1 PDZ/DHR/GLGF domain protein [Natranaerobius thermophilus JW/NM-WN-LF]
MQDFNLITLLQLLGQSLVMPHLPVLYILVTLLVFRQYRRSVKMEQKLFGRIKNSPVKLTLYSIGLGIIAGLFASIILIFFGVNLIELGIPYVWAMVIILLLFHPRYMCFAYGGGVIGLISLILSQLAQYYPEILEFWIVNDLVRINVPALVTLVAILHLTESFLILVSGHISPSPIYVRHEQEGIVGGFSLQKFWPLPVMGIIGWYYPEANIDFAMSMPDWWPIVGSTITAPEGYQMMYQFLPVVVGLGYGDMAISSNPKAKSKSSAFNLALYSITLLVLAVISSYYGPLTWLAVLLLPLGHEAIIIVGNSREFSRKPLYSQHDRGIKVLDVLPNSVGQHMGLKSGDVILSINNIPVSNKQDLLTNLYQSQPYVRMNVETLDGEQKFVKAPLYEHSTHLGLILSPETDGHGNRYINPGGKNRFEGLLRKLLGKSKKKNG